VNYPWLEEAQQQFALSRANGRLAHACLITGREGLGKVEFALQLAADLLCLQQGPVACGTCRSCRLLVSGAHPDFKLITFEINPKTAKFRTVLVVDQIRELIAGLQLTRALSPRKAAVIQPAEAMNSSASNALLKMLEEPPVDTFLLLVSHDPARLPATIRSRCRAIHLRLPDEQTAREWIAAGHEYEAESIALALQASAGSPLQARQMLETGQVDQYGTVTELLARLASSENSVGETLAALADLDPHDTWKWLSLIAAAKLRASFELSAKPAPGKKQQTPTGPDMINPARLAALQILADRNRYSLSTSLHKDLLLRDWLIQWCRLDHE